MSVGVAVPGEQQIAAVLVRSGQMQRADAAGVHTDQDAVATGVRHAQRCAVGSVGEFDAVACPVAYSGQEGRAAIGLGGEFPDQARGDVGQGVVAR